MDTKYNGWTNYATWRVNLEVFDNFDVTNLDHFNDTYELSILLKEYLNWFIDETTEDGLTKDYALAFISDVNWYEIAEHLLESEA